MLKFKTYERAAHLLTTGHAFAIGSPDANSMLRSLAEEMIRDGEEPESLLPALGIVSGVLLDVASRATGLTPDVLIRQTIAALRTAAEDPEQ